MDYSKAIDFDPNYKEAYYNRGNSYKAKGNKIVAYSDFQQSADLGFEPAKEELRKLDVNEKGEPL